MVETCLNGVRKRFPASDLLFEARKYQDIRVDGHTDRENETGDPGQGKRYVQQLEQRERERRVNDQREDGHDARQSVIEDHEETDDTEANDAGDKRPVNRILAKGRANGAALNDCERNVERASFELDHKILGFLG